MVNKKVWLVIALLTAIAALFTALSVYATDIFKITSLAISNANDISPADRIKEYQIMTDEDSVTISLSNAVIGRFTDTNSMSPIIDENANAILTKPNTISDIAVGDIISYYSEEAQGLVVHRVVKLASDEQGWYALAKGDNADDIDPGKVRFAQVKYIIAGILY